MLAQKTKWPGPFRSCPETTTVVVAVLKAVNCSRGRTSTSRETLDDTQLRLLACEYRKFVAIRVHRIDGIWERSNCMSPTMRLFTQLIATLVVWVAPATVHCAPDPPPPAANNPLVPELKIEKYCLDNGLTVILHEDHKTPLVAINVVYNVGSKDDKPGRTGSAHLFEHMMLEGSLHSEQRFADALSNFVERPNATTERDRTSFYETVTTDALEQALWLESDRMAFLLPVLTEDKLSVVRDVVKNDAGAIGIMFRLFSKVCG